MSMNIEKILLFLIMLVGAIYLFPEDAMAAECSASTVCGVSCDYDGQTYNTVLIGTQCWFKENLNVGTMITNLEVPDNTPPTPNDPNTATKWCYNNDSLSCSEEGGLYTWAEANALPDSCNSTLCSVPDQNQGICPQGWHIPSDAEQHTLNNFLKEPGQTCDPTRSGWDCYDSGVKLKIGGSSGFDAITAGNLGPADKQFDKREPSIHIWSSSIARIGYAYKSTLGIGQDTVGRWGSRMTYGFTARCLADVTITGPQSKEECKDYGWMAFSNPSFKNQGECVSYCQSNSDQ